MSTTTNYEKHNTKNPISRFFLNNFLQTVIETIKDVESGLYSSSPSVSLRVNESRNLSRHSEFSSESKKILKPFGLAQGGQVQDDNIRSARTITKIDSILDVGCGEGFTLDRLQQEGIGKNLEGVDAVDEALKIGKKLYPKLTLKKENIYDLQYKPNSFELVLCTEVLEHVDNPKKALQELIRVSRRYVLLTVPNEPWFTYMRIARGKNLLQFGSHPEHVNVWSSGAFEQFVQQNNVHILTKKHPFPWIMILLEKQ